MDAVESTLGTGVEIDRRRLRIECAAAPSRATDRARKYDGALRRGRCVEGTDAIGREDIERALPDLGREVHDVRFAEALARERCRQRGHRLCS